MTRVLLPHILITALQTVKLQLQGGLLLPLLPAGTESPDSRLMGRLLTASPIGKVTFRDRKEKKR